MTVMRGATIPAARNPAVKSDAKRRPRFFVFQTLGSTRVSTAILVRRTAVFNGVLEDEDALGSILDVGISTPGIEGVIVWALIPRASNMWGMEVVTD
jgi:hypothetical protein